MVPWNQSGCSAGCSIDWDEAGTTFYGAGSDVCEGMAEARSRECPGDGIPVATQWELDGTTHVIFSCSGVSV